MPESGERVSSHLPTVRIPRYEQAGFTYYRKKPVLVAAVHWEGDFDVVHRWLDALGYQDDDDPAMWENRDGSVTVLTLEGEMRCDPGDWLICGVAGEVYPCKPDIFEDTYQTDAAFRAQVR